MTVCVSAGVRSCLLQQLGVREVTTHSRHSSAGWLHLPGPGLRSSAPSGNSMGSLIISHKLYFIIFNISTVCHPCGLGTLAPQMILKSAQSSVSFSDFFVPGCAQVSLLRCDSGPVCEGGTTWLQFPRRTAGGAREAGQGRAVEDLERNSTHCRWVTEATPPQTRFCLHLLMIDDR